jgi:drug/metabolite transporter (DMT)-like permease
MLPKYEAEKRRGFVIVDAGGTGRAARTEDHSVRTDPLDLRSRIGGGAACGRRPDYRLGTIHSLVASALLAIQLPFSTMAARRLPLMDFIAITQIALLASLPLMLSRPEARRDFVKIVTAFRAWPKLVALLGVGVAGITLYNVGLRNANPIIVAAVLNLSPFWAALVAFFVSRKPLPGSGAVFFGCFGFAFFGAIAISWSQVDEDSAELLADVIAGALRSHWIYALPAPILFALSGTLVYVWFSDYDESAAVGANFLVSALVLIPAASWTHFRDGGRFPTVEVEALLLLLVGTLASAAAGRLAYQAALSATQNDNGFVTMFFLVIPPLSALVSWPLSIFLPELKFASNALFFAGLALVTAPLLVFAAACMVAAKKGRARPA